MWPWMRRRTFGSGCRIRDAVHPTVDSPHAWQVDPSLCGSLHGHGHGTHHTRVSRRKVRCRWTVFLPRTHRTWTCVCSERGIKRQRRFIQHSQHPFSTLKTHSTRHCSTASSSGIAPPERSCSSHSSATPAASRSMSRLLMCCAMSSIATRFSAPRGTTMSAWLFDGPMKVSKDGLTNCSYLVVVVGVGGVGGVGEGRGQGRGGIA